MNPYNCHQNLNTSFSLTPKGQIQNIVSLFQNFLVFDPLSPSLFFDLVESSPFFYPNTKLPRPKQKNPKTKCKKKKWELNSIFQEMWAAKLSWVEAMVWCDRKLIMVCCKMCSEIEGREKNLVPKFHSVQKHVGRQKCKVACPSVLWVKNPCQQKTNMKKMSVHGLVRVKALLLN
jgi:hypothetical protein